MSRRSIVLRVLPLLSLLGGFPVARADHGPETEVVIVPLHVRVARALYPRERWRRMVKDASDAMTQRIAERGSGHFELSPEFRDRLREQYEEMVPYEELVSYQASILSSTYSSDELAELLTFCESPTGQKSIRFLDELVRDADNQLQLAFLQRLPRALDNLRPLVHELPDAAQAEPEGGWQ